MNKGYVLFLMFVAGLALNAFCSGESASPFTVSDHPYYTGTVFPAPKQARYEDKFIKLKTLTIIPGSGIKADDMQVKLLSDKLKSWIGSEAVLIASSVPEKGTVILIDVEGEGKPAPEQPEGYSLVSYTKEHLDVIAINSSDRLGRLWGIVSLLQLVKRADGTVSVRCAEISDWPDHPARGCLTNQFPDRNEAAMIFTKANTFVFQIRPPEGYSYWQTFVNDGPQNPGPEIMRLAPLFRDLGLNVYFLINPAAGNPKLSTSDTDFELIVDWLCKVAEMNVGVYFAYDDVRFPVPESDMKKFGSAAATDSYLIPKIFNAVRARHPDFKMVFCPPFYWGPGTPHPYPEDRETYLRLIGETFPPEIDIFWTGPRVQSSLITKEDVEWFTNLIGRKPWLFQNRGWLPNKYDSSFVTDRITAWTDWRYDGFWSDMAVPLLNLHANQNIMSLASIADFLWNTAEYDAERSVRAGAGMYFGQEAFHLLEKMNKALSYFNQYPGNQATPAAVGNLPEIEEKLAELKTSFENLVKNAPHPETVERMTVFRSRVGFAERFVRNLKKAATEGMAKFVEFENDTRAKAVEESGLTDADIFITPSSLTGGNGYMVYATRCEPRFAVWINGKQSPNNEMRTRFQCEPFPPERDYEMIIMGQEDAAEGKSCNIRISVNGKTLYEGVSGFPRHGWAKRSFKIPADMLQRGNTLTFTNLDDGTSRAPWFMVNYIIIRR